jgi:glycosyltransferase involved in cell wall biosynthesis
MNEGGHPPVRVLHLIGSLTVGGAEKLLLGLLGRIDRTRVEPHVMSMAVVRGNQLQDEFERLGLPVSSAGATRYFSPAAALAVARYVRRERIDLVHTHLIGADLTGALVGRILRVPVVTTLHNEPRNYDARRPWGTLERVAVRRLATRLVAVSESIGQRFVTEWGVPAERVTTIPNSAVSG